MAKLDLSVAMGDFDRSCAPREGTVHIAGVDPVHIELPARG
jgi:hypothetical protein